MKTLIRILTESVRRHGADTPLTLGHLLNIVKMWHRVTRRQAIRAERREERNHQEALLAAFNDHGQR